MTQPQLDALAKVQLAVLGVMKTAGPMPLASLIAGLAASLQADAESVGEKALATWLPGAEANEPLLNLWHQTLAAWDCDAEPGWAGGTEPGSAARREGIYDILQIGADCRSALDSRLPFIPKQGPVVISKIFKPWYDAEVQAESGHYWQAYRRLLEAKNWSPTAIASLHAASARVVERLADPSSQQPRQAKGLVVGYVQSGKTANFTGVVAKAVDAGYRLVIVLTGTIEALRAQTQRRMDMELLGIENIFYGKDPATEQLSPNEYDYLDDQDLGKFLKHGGLPSTLGAFDFIRLTGHRIDYQSQKNNVAALDFVRDDSTLPLHHPSNLARASARLIIAKKNATVLTKLEKDLKKLKLPLHEIPALIIDDESDEASVNTVNPAKVTDGKSDRTAINKCISNLLRMLPRAQYVGYTATPFANVFIDPGDSEDIFPSDFLLSLARPDGYMGVRDFHDIDWDPSEERTAGNSAEKAFVRDVKADGSSDSLREAIDMFVLTGAVKLWREENGYSAGYFRHHTMLVHSSHKQADHRDQAEEIKTLWRSAGYAGAGRKRLRDLYEKDLAEVSAVRAEGAPNPSSFDDLGTYISDAVARIAGVDGPVTVVNGDPDVAKSVADFTKASVWRILVGGAKLSRGFTIEGLTVSYFARKTMQASSLMQMGRWFGFRPGYRDLVRLYIARDVKHGLKTVDLYEAFEAVCRDEEHFRDQLAEYAVMVDGQPQVTPAQVPPLVGQHLSWLKPAATNKMFNAKLVEIRSPGAPIEPRAYPLGSNDVSHNFAAVAPLGAAATELVQWTYPKNGGASRGTFSAFAGIVPHDVVLESLAKLRWLRDGLPFAPHLHFLRGHDLAAATDDWLVFSPAQISQKVGAHTALVAGGIPVGNRKNQPGSDFRSTIADPNHRHPAFYIARNENPLDCPTVAKFAAPKRGAILLYVLASSETEQPVEFPAVVIFAPGTASSADGKRVLFTAHNSLTDAPIV